MSPLDRLRVEKAGADCGFEMTAVPRANGLELRSARFPETVLVTLTGESSFEVFPTDPAIIDWPAEGGPPTAHGYAQLYALLRTAAARARTKPNRVCEVFKKTTVTMPQATEAERLTVQRIGQGLFRSALLDYWQGKCCVTGLEVHDLLRASHIRPWAECDTDEQRLDVFNGLLLAPHVDALFDRGWISFEDSGQLLVAPELPHTAWGPLGLTSSWCSRGLTDGHRAYLSYHRARVFRHSESLP